MLYKRAVVTMQITNVIAANVIAKEHSLQKASSAYIELYLYKH